MRLARLGALFTAITGVFAVMMLSSPAYAGGPDHGGHGGHAGQGGQGGHWRPDVLRFANYNIKAGSGEDNVFDPARTARTISSLYADVVGLEEVDVHWSARSNFSDVAADLARRTHMFSAFAPIYTNASPTPGKPPEQYGVALLSRYPILSVQNHEITRLSTQETNPTPKPAPGFLETVLLTPVGLVHTYVTHLDYRADPSVRAQQVKDQQAILSQDPRGSRQVVLGDFNAEPSAPELAPWFTTMGDAWANARHTTGGPNTYPATTPVKRIDLITYSRGIGVLDAFVPSDPALIAASDHRPVAADLEFRGGWFGR